MFIFAAAKEADAEFVALLPEVMLLIVDRDCSEVHEGFEAEEEKFGAVLFAPHVEEVTEL